MLYRLAFFFVIATGFTGLVYQITWHKYLSFYLGSHAMAAALVLAVFFLFLSLGYSIFGRNIHRIPVRNKLFLYGIIEAVIGLYAVLSPEIFHLLATVLPAGGQSQGSDFFLGFLFTTVYIGFPTFLMGTTIPVLTQALSRDFDTSHATHAAVYGLNTLGAVFGALLAGFVLIDLWGLPLTLLNTGMLNIAIGLATWVIWKYQPLSFVGIAPQPEALPSSNTVLDRRWVFLLYAISFASGFYVFSLENLMIRVAGLVIGSSSYTFAMIVAAFILGIALGSLWIGRRRVESPRVFLWVQIALLASTVALYMLVPLLPDLLARLRVVFAPSYMNIPFYWASIFVFFSLILLFPVALMGMNLPLIFNYLRSRGLFLSQTVGRIYGINTFGSVLGSLVGGYLLFFVLRWDGVFRFNLALIALTLPFIFLLIGRRRIASMAFSAFAIIAVLALPRWDDAAFLPSPAMISSAPRAAESLEPTLERLRSGTELRFVYHGPSAHIGVLEAGGEPQLHINGNPNTASGDWELRAMNAIYPLSFVKNPDNVFVVGLGGGLSASIFAEHPEIERVLVSEIAIGAIKALPYFDIQNSDFTSQPYFDKVEFVAADAIKVLRSSDEKFDIIVSEPNHPWVAGVENLFSVEFLSEVRDRLDDGGVYCQWFPLFVSEPQTTLTILNTFRQVFPEVRIFSTGGGTLSIVAGTEPLAADLSHIGEIVERYRHRLEARDSVFTNPKLILATEIMNDRMLGQIVDGVEATHTFEFPVVSKSAFRAKFAGVRTNFAQSVADRLHEVAPGNQAEARMLYEPLRDELDASFFDDAFRGLVRRGDPLTVSLPRFWHQRVTWFDGTPDWPDVDDQAVLAYVSGVSDEFPTHLREDDSIGEVDATLELDQADMTSSSGGLVPSTMRPARDENQQLRAAAQLFSVYRQLIRAQAPARLDRVVAEVPEDCDLVACARLEQAILITAQADREAARILDELDPAVQADRERIHAEFDLLRDS